MAKPKLRKRLVVRIATPLINQLKSCAQRDGRPLSSYVRKILSDAAAISTGEGAQLGAGRRESRANYDPRRVRAAGQPAKVKATPVAIVAVTALYPFIHQ
jgi:hypothetical protein